MDHELWAHSANPAGVRHGLVDHLRGTAARAVKFASVFGAGELAGGLGILHDIGKSVCVWQEGLKWAESRGSRVVDAGGASIDHKLAGTWLAVRKANLGPFALSILGHHGGLSSRRALKDAMSSAEAEAADRVQEAVRRVSGLIPEILDDRRSAVPAWGCSSDDPYAAELLLRMTFSALVDADFLDTESHFTGERSAVPSLASMVETFEGARDSYLGDTRSPIDLIRSEVYDQAVQAAGGPVGIFPFPAPTGAGKTIAAGGFAAHHAARHGLRRVIVAVPFLSITEQNAQVYRTLFGADNVLEHHSGVNLDELPAALRWQRLAAENWDAPVVVTTTVRLFESLFSRKPSAMRKLHRLAGAVIVLDEVQSLPDGMLPPILSALRTLTEHFGTSVLLASATQPEFFSLGVFAGLQARSVIVEPKPLYKGLRRVKYEWRIDPRPTFAQVAEEAAQKPQVLAIVNTTKDAATLHEYLEKMIGEDVLHLSTRMAGGHRRSVLREIRSRLNEGLPVTVVSTQLVEAGVDLDFPVVFRAFAPAEALQQAAGRSNRNGLLAFGRVIVFDPADGSVTGARRVYGAALDTTRVFFGPGLADPDDLDALSAYYQARYALKDIEKVGPGAEIQRYRAEFDFPEVAERFKLVDEQTVPVLVPYGDDAERERLRGLLMSPGGADPWVFRKLQPYLATLPRRRAAQAVKEGLATELLGGLIEWHGEYHRRRGVEFTDPSGEDFVW
ncbi:CRISPR-associated helicase Cas3' [Actinomadura graeca]|uniref:CRISPR-associated helicase Cas3 n=1 Tax=Actinomadura graeca TaxID=2750812 RepID=A0ABX8QRX7_9ACTN|nr:CRISPR-associated helicase Cas3' [Actinomadura graeca]QXJ21569.1 CRISPR-associated helicase Cas3' [Actinomadura graeca]